MNANTNNVTVNMENLSAEERATLISLMEKANNKGYWVPAIDERYYFLYNDGDISSTINRNDDSDKHRIAQGNYYKTREDAQFAVECNKVLQELRVLANGYKLTPGVIRWYLYSENNRVKVGSYCDMIHHGVCFATSEAAKAAIEKIGEDRLKKYYFCL